MRINVISTLNNGVGLQSDTRLMVNLLTSLGHQAVPTDRFRPESARKADLNIFLEVIEEKFFPLATTHWLIPNPEWYYPEAWDRFLPKIDTVICKTHDCLRIFKPKHKRSFYIGFMSADWNDPGVPRRKEFLHVRGKSKYKNTKAVLQAWREFQIQAPLTVISEDNPLAEPIDNVTWRGYVSAGMLRAIYNSRLFHLCPSEYEGFGHYIHEALGCGAIVITTDLPPMNEISGCPSELRLPTSVTYECQLATMGKVSATAIAEAIQHCLSLDDETIVRYQKVARESFETETKEFQERLSRLMHLL